MTETKANGTGDAPAFDDIGSFDDFWTVRERIFIFFFNHGSIEGYARTDSRWFVYSKMVQ